MHIAFFGSSLLSSYWNGAATYYRGILSALARRGWRVTFYEPDAFDRQRHRDIDPPAWAEVVVFEANEAAMRTCFAEAAAADVIVKANGVGVLDTEILKETVRLAEAGKVALFWDVDAPATLAEIAASAAHPVAAAVPRIDGVFTYGGGDPVVAGYMRAGARLVLPVYNALDPATHFPVAPDPRFAADLAFLGNRLPDRESRVESFFFEAARRQPGRAFLLAGSGWEPWQLPANVRAIGHLPTADHNAFNCTPLAVINISRADMAAMGFSPATRVFEAAGAGACIITDRWQGIELFLEPDREVLVAGSGADVASLVATLTPERAMRIGEKARSRVLREHTYTQRAQLVDGMLRRLLAARAGRAVA